MRVSLYATDLSGTRPRARGQKASLYGNSIDSGEEVRAEADARGLNGSCTDRNKNPGPERRKGQDIGGC